MVLRQTLKAAGAGEALGKHEPSSVGHLLLLGIGPPVHVLQQVGQRGLFKRPLEVFVPARVRASSAGRAHSDRAWGSPADQLVEHLDILLHVRHLHRLLGVDDGERGERGAVVDVLAAGLEEAADEEEFEEGVCILEKLERRAGLD